MTDLGKGANRPLTDPEPQLVVTGAQQGTVDLLLFQLTAARRVRSDADMVFFNQPRSPEGAVTLTGGDRARVVLAQVPADIEVLAVAVALDDAVPGSLADVPALGVGVQGADPVTATATGLSTERAAVLVEIYRRDGGWKIRNVSAGWAGGLAALATEHGVSVDDAPPAAAGTAPAPPAAPTPAANPTPPPAPATPAAFPPPNQPAAAFPPPNQPAAAFPPPQQPAAAFPPPQPAAAAPAPAAGGRVDLGKRSGAISLTKGQRVEIDSSELIVASITWPPATDYDVYALVRYRDGRTEAVSAFGTHENKAFSLHSSDGAVRHLGDVGRSGGGRKKGGLFGGRQAQQPQELAVERIEIRPHAGIAAIVPVAYSAQSNGTGSFRRYQVSMSIDNGRGTTVTVPAANADANDQIYSCVPGIIAITDSGVVIDSLELYSAPGSEKRPTIGPDLRVLMDTGETNLFK